MTADESNVARKRIFTEFNRVVLVNIIRRLSFFFTPLFSGKSTLNSRRPQKQGTEIPLLHFEIGMQMTLSQTQHLKQNRVMTEDRCEPEGKRGHYGILIYGVYLSKINRIKRLAAVFNF